MDEACQPLLLLQPSLPPLGGERRRLSKRHLQDAGPEVAATAPGSRRPQAHEELGRADMASGGLQGQRGACSARPGREPRSGRRDAALPCGCQAPTCAPRAGRLGEAGCRLPHSKELLQLWGVGHGQGRPAGRLEPGTWHGPSVSRCPRAIPPTAAAPWGRFRVRPGVPGAEEACVWGAGGWMSVAVPGGRGVGGAWRASGSGGCLPWGRLQLFSKRESRSSLLLLGRSGGPR